MSINRVTTFWSALSALSFREMVEVSDEIASLIPDNEVVTRLHVANALSDAAESKELPATRGNAR